MDPWSKVDYSRRIREASMEMEGLPVVNPPYGRVKGQRLLVAPILKRRRRRNREEIGNRASSVEGFPTRGKYRRKGAARGPPGALGAQVARPRGAAWTPGGSPLAPT